MTGDSAKCLAATFRRVSQHPGGPFYLDGDRSGGAALDLHIHDADFVQYCFGMPRAVTSVGYAKITNQPDHLVTHYHYADFPLVMAEGSWCMHDGFPFSMGFTVNFEERYGGLRFGGPVATDAVRSGPRPPGHRDRQPNGVRFGDRLLYQLYSQRDSA